jgi:hypothetical protein
MNRVDHHLMKYVSYFLHLRKVLLPVCPDVYLMVEQVKCPCALTSNHVILSYFIW